MCHNLPSHSNWIADNATLIVAIAALCIAVLQGWLMVWQVRKARKLREQEVLVDLRYAITMKAQEMLTYYQAKEEQRKEGVPLTPYRNEFGIEIDPKSIRLTIAGMLTKPTIMSQEERRSILLSLNTLRDFRSAALFYDAMLSRLDPEIAHIFEVENTEASKPPQ
jgi:hypothetical protein